LAGITLPSLAVLEIAIDVSVANSADDHRADILASIVFRSPTVFLPTALTIMVVQTIRAVIV
jgi:hypothetical protein